jgi:putative peptidoglycan lipid II flippase
MGLLAEVRIQGVPLGAVGLALGASIGAWLEWWLLHRGLRRRMGAVGAGGKPLAAMFGAAVLAALLGYGVKRLLGGLHPVGLAACVGAVFGFTYLLAARLFNVGEAHVLIDSVLARLRR